MRQHILHSLDRTPTWSTLQSICDRAPLNGLSFSAGCPPKKVVRTNGHDEVPARAVNLIVGRAAYETTVRLFPKDAIQYRNGTQIIARSDG